MDELKIDISKVLPTPEDGYHAVALLVEHGQNIIEALHIMDYAIRHPDELDDKRMKEFINKFSNERSNLPF